MAVIQLRGQFNDQGFKGLVNNPHDRKAAAKKIAEALGFKFLNYYFAPATGSAVVTFEGDPNKMPLLELVTMESGSFLTCGAEILTPIEELLEMQETANELLSQYDAPNRDEIDRMLLDE